MRPMLMISMLLAAALLQAGGLSDLQVALGRFKSGQDLKGTLELGLWEEQKQRKRTDSGEATIQVNIDLSGSGLREHWDLPTLAHANEEAHKRDMDSAILSPFRDALKELDPARLYHLLNQQDVLAKLVQESSFKEEKLGEFEGQPVRLLNFTYKPRIPAVDMERLKRAEATLRIWITQDGTPMASESKVDYWGKTSRMFGLYKVQQRMESRYQTVNGHLVVTRRISEEFRSESDGSESVKFKKSFIFRVSAP